MIYLYIDIEGKIAQCDQAPTGTDLKSIDDGQLTVIRLNVRQSGIQIFPEEFETSVKHWVDVQQAELEKTDDGFDYHYCP